MTRIVVKHPRPVEARYTGDDIHKLVCQHEKEWRSIPVIGSMMHERRKDGYHSRVTGLAWFYYCGMPLDAIRAKLGGLRCEPFTVEHLEALMQVLGIQRVQARY